MCSSISRKEPLQRSLDYLVGRSHVGNDHSSGKHLHKACVCVVCDTFIKGTEPICYLTSDQLVRKSSVLSVNYYNKTTNKQITPNLREQYKLSDDCLKNLLLSPRSIRTGSGYMCCKPCYKHLRASKQCDKPPKFAISDGFAIGSVPTQVVDEISDVLAAMIAPVRVLSYVFNYYGGAHKAVKGSHMFFVNDPQHIGATFNHIVEGAEKSVYTMISGRVTPTQRDIVRRRTEVNTDEYRKLLRWFILNHPSYASILPPEECPKPIRIGGFESTQNNTENEEDPSVENQFECSTFRFAPRTQINESTGPFTNEDDFIVSKLMNKEIDFTLLFQYGTRIQSHLTKLHDMFPVQFPFGRGGPDETRSIHASTKACFKHYARLSLPQMMRADFLLVICSLYQSIECYTSAVISCKSSWNRSTVGEEVSRLSLDEMKQATKRVLDGIEPTATMNRLFSSVSASCRTVGQSNEAAKVARKKYFSLWHRFGSPSVFFTVSPCDECSFRVRLFSNANCSHYIPSTSQIMDLQNCILDLQFRKKTRSTYPGACAHEFESIMQIVIEVLIGWKDGKGVSGIFGVPIAFADSVEEQCRYTLHAHICVWIEHFNEIRQLIFDDNETIKQAARDEMLNYFKTVAQASFGDLDIFVPGSESDPSVNTSGSFSESKGDPNTVFQGSEPSNQKIRKMRHFKHCLSEKGVIASITKDHDMFCNTGSHSDHVPTSLTFSGTDLVDLHTKKAMRDVSNDFCSKQEILDRMSYLLPYHMYSDVRLRPPDCQPPLHLQYCIPMSNCDSSSSLSNLEAKLSQFSLRYPLLQLRFNSHDFKHRKGCFKKGCECRFNLPKGHQVVATIEFDDDNAMYWHFIDGSKKKISRYEYMAQRNTGDQFVNMSNDIASCVLGCNTNVGIADRTGFFYVTMYASKQNQAEEKIAYLSCCEALCRRIKRQQSQQSQQEELNQDDSSDVATSSDSLSDGNYAEGFKRILSAMYAHLSNDVVAATMAHLLLIQDGSRFSYSHDFVTIPLPHLLSWYDGEDLYFRLKKLPKIGNSDKDNQNELDDESNKSFADYFINNYIYRPVELGDYSCYDLFSKYEMVHITTSRRKKADDSFDESVFRMHPDHPGYKRFVMKLLLYEKVPQITSTKLLPNVTSTFSYPGNDVVDADVSYYREKYAKIALLLFSPYRKKSDIIKNGSFWEVYEDAFCNNKLPDTSYTVLQNIQDVQHNCTSQSNANIDPIFRSTVYEKSDEDKDMKKKVSKDDPNVVEYNEIEKMFNSLSPDVGFEPDDLKRDLSFITSKHDIPSSKINVDMLDSDNLKSIVDVPSEIVQEVEGNANGARNVEWNDDEHLNQDPLIIEYLAYGLLSQHLYDDDYVESRILDELDLVSINMEKFASSQGLDLVQTAAFEVMASSFILTQLEMHDITEKGILKLFPDDIDTCQSKIEKLDKLISLLEKRGGLKDLFMFLSGMGGSGKSRVINSFKTYSHNVSNHLNWHYDFDTVKITAMTGSAAALLPDGRTLHSTAHINTERKNITDKDRSRWKHTRVLIIDEISFMASSTLNELDRKLKLLRQNDKRFGDIQVIIVGDFHQLNPVKNNCPLYRGGNVLMQAMNRAVFLNKCHRFKNDEQFGNVMKRFRDGCVTSGDLMWINERYIENNDVLLPEFDNLRYACSQNTHRNAISNALFKRHLEQTHSRSVDDSVDCPHHTCIIKATMRKTVKAARMIPTSLRNLIFDTVGDAHMVNNDSRKVDPALKFYHNKPLLITSNDRIEDKLANGTPCRGLYLKLKDGVEFTKECWGGFMVNTVYAHHVDYMVCVHEKKNDDDPEVYFKIEPESLAVQVTMPTMRNFKFRGINATQFGINDNIATTCHKLQGVSLDSLVIDTFDYRLENWVYVVLSRVTTRNGLVLCEKIDINCDFKVNEVLSKWEERIRNDLEKKLFTMRGELGQYIDESINNN